MERNSAVWNDVLVNVLCELCIKEVDKNNRPNTHLNKDGWESVVSNFNKETGKNYSKKQLKNKWDALKEQWKLWKDLKGKETGLGWDYRLQTIDASEEWWSAKILENKEYAKLRKKGIALEFEEKLDRMFKGTSATGMHAYVPGASLPLPRSPKQGDNQEDLEESVNSDEASQPKSKGKRKRNDTDAVEKCKGVVTKPGRVGGAALLAKKIDRMCEAIENRSSASSISNKNERVCDMSTKEVMKVVGSLPGAERGTRLYFFAAKLLTNPEKRSKLFNQAHSSLRGVIERTFGVWKKKGMF